MTIVTEAAKEKLKVIQQKNTDPDVTIRVVESSSTNKLDLVWDSEKEGDHVLESKDGTKVLLIGPDVAPIL